RTGSALGTHYKSDVEPHVAELAHHFFQAAGNGHAGRAAEYAGRAAERAVSQFAYEEGVRLYRVALQSLDLGSPRREDQRLTLLLGLGDALRRAGDVPEARGAFWQAATLAQQLNMPEGLAAAALGYGGPWADLETIAIGRLVRLLEQALEAMPEQDSPLRARLLARLAGALSSSTPRPELSQQALEMARRLGDGATLAYVLEAG